MKKWGAWGGAILLTVSVFLLFEIMRIREDEPFLDFLSPGKSFHIEAVPVKSILSPSGRWAFIRVREVSDQASFVYVSPLVNREFLDMQAFEDANHVGVAFVDFDKVSKVFTIRISGWCPHWLNPLISNTGYKVSQDWSCQP